MAGIRSAAAMGQELEHVYLVNVDGDNVITEAWLQSAMQRAQIKLASLPKAWVQSVKERDPSEAGLTALQGAPGLKVGTQWVNKEMGTFGRIGLPALAFSDMGGHDQ